jgi:hypothetical protein
MGRFEDEGTKDEAAEAEAEEWDGVRSGEILGVGCWRFRAKDLGLKRALRPPAACLI